MSRRAIPILMYHEVSSDAHESFRKYVVAPRVFERQMLWLAAAGYKPITLTTLLASCMDGAPLPRRPVVITFDDGFRDCVRHAGDILQRRGFCAVFFLVGGLVGETSRWLVRERGFELPLAGWTEIRHLAERGFEFGTHSLTHPRLAALPAGEAYYELLQSRRVVEDALGRAVIHFAYPFGSVNGSVRAAAADAGYQTACTVNIGVSRPDDDLLMLRRIPVTGYDSLIDFVCRMRTGRTVAQSFRHLGRWSWPQHRPVSTGR